MCVHWLVSINCTHSLEHVLCAERSLQCIQPNMFASIYVVYVVMLYYIHLGASTPATTHCARENFYLPAHSGGMHICICTYAMYTHRSVWMYSRKRKRGHFHNACAHHTTSLRAHFDACIHDAYASNRRHNRIFRCTCTRCWCASIARVRARATEMCMWM